MIVQTFRPTFDTIPHDKLFLALRTRITDSGGNPVASSKGTSYFNDTLGTTVGSKQGGKYSAAALTAFGESLETLQGEVTSNIKHQCQVRSVSQRAFIFFNGSLDKQNVGVRNNETIFV